MVMTLTDQKRNTYKDEFGRVICVENKDFFKYIKDKNISLGDVLKLPVPKREELYLKWKHGLSDPAANREIELSMMSDYHRDLHTDLEHVDPYFKDWVVSRRSFEAYCNHVKQQIKI